MIVRVPSTQVLRFQQSARCRRFSAAPVLALLVAVGALSNGCQDAGPPTSPQHEHREGDEEHDEERVAEAGDHAVVRIQPDMLRDLRITTASAELRSASEGVTALGEIRVNEDAYAEVGSLILGRVVEVLVRSGEAIAAGQPLARLQSVELGRARSTYRSAVAAAKLAERTLQRKRQLAEQRIVPLREVYDAEAAETGAQAELEAAKGALSALGIATDDAAAEEGGESSVYTLRSPIAGTLLERNAVQGQTTDPASPLFRIADLSRLWLIVQSFERDAPRVQSGAQARVVLPALPGRSFSGTVELIGSQVDGRSRTVPIRVVLENKDRILLPGMSASAWLPLGEGNESLTAVPAAAVQRLEDHWVVFIPAGERAFAVRPIGRGRDLGGEIEILTGLQPGETVVVDGAFLLRAEAEKGHDDGGHHHH